MRSARIDSLRSFAAPLLLAGVTMLAIGGCATTTRTGPVIEEAPRNERNPVIAQALELARAGRALTGDARRANDAQVNRLLSQLDNATLVAEAAALPEGEPLYDYAGRALLQRGLPLPRPFARGADWRFDAGDRPAAERDGYRPPQRVAVLLPLSGSMAATAASVRDGFLAGYHNESRRRPDVQFYDTAGGAGAAYDRAVADGRDFVVGPLGRDEVGALFNKGTLPVAVLALNRAASNPPSGTASFSLSPEDEGTAAAEALLALNARRVLVVGGGDDTQRRAIAALREALANRGGAVTDSVSEATADFAPMASKDGGVDAVYLAMKGSSARAVMPKLALAGLAGKPVYASSQLLSGTGKAEQDRALDGVAFPSETWTTRGLPGLPSDNATAALLPTARGPAARLFAFGHDAWLITAYLEKLATSSDSIAGATGVLRLDGFGNVQRTPAWSVFRDGVAVPLADARN